MHWNKDEFKAYVLLFVAHSNHIESEEESDYILSKINENLYNKIHTEIVMDATDKIRCKKIQDYLAFYKYSEEEKRKLLIDIKQVIFADGTVDNLEKKVFNFLKKVLS